MSALIRYEAACRALAEAHAVDEVKAIRDKAVAMQAYARQAKDITLITQATEIRLRAERRAGELLREMPKNQGGRPEKTGSSKQPVSTPKLSDLGVTKTQSSRWQKLADFDDATFEVMVERTKRKAILAVEGSGTQQLGGTGDNEYLTPTQYVAAVRDVLGTIDLDPASCPEAQAIVQATRYFTKDDDGLQYPWRGRVFLNPPFSRDLIGPFVRKLIAEYEIGRVQEAILLTASNTSSRWFQEAARIASAICFTNNNIAFVHRTRGAMKQSAALGQAFFYFGTDVEKFAHRFAEIGFIAAAWQRNEAKGITVLSNEVEIAA